MTTRLRGARLRRAATVLTSLAVGAAGVAVLSVAGASPATAAAVSVGDATLTWDLNDEATGAAFAPGTWNLMSAGRISDPGEGGTTLTTGDDGATWSNGAAAGWSAQSGNVSVEDLQADGSYAPATFAGTRTNSAGDNSNTGAKLGETRLVFSDGTGSVDPATGEATISWDGDATLLFYSGMSFFYLSDPELTVDADGDGAITATVGGFGTSQENPDQWTPLADTEVTLATLSDVEVGATGFTATPDYRGVTYTGAPAQVTTGDDAGSFPQSFVDALQPMGTAAYWYSTGGATDARKVANPLTVAFAPAPSVTVSRTDFLPTGEAQVTVTGANFDPDEIIATRPPLAGHSGGVYVAVGRYAATWRPSQGATSAARKNADVRWAVLADDMATVGGTQAGAIELRPDGSFTATLTVDKAAIDAAAGDAAVTEYGIVTYPGGGVVNADYETFTPITFSKRDASLSISAPARKYGQAGRATVSLTTDGDRAGSLVLKRGSKVVGTADAVDGRASFDLGALPAGSYALSAGFTGNDTTSAAVATATYRVAKAGTKTTVKVAKKPRPRAKGKAVVSVTSSTTTPTGKVRIQIKRGSKVVKTLKAALNKRGKVAVTLPKAAKGTYRLVVTYNGTRNIATSSRKVTLRVS